MNYTITGEDTIEFEDDFNESLDQHIEALKKIKHLKFGKKFDQSVDNLPENIETITFGMEFNRPVDNLPGNLKGLKFEYRFNQNIDFLPASVKFLELGENFNRPLDNLPTGLETLIIKSTLVGCYNNLPRNLKLLSIDSGSQDFAGNQHFYLRNLPEGLTHFYIGDTHETERTTWFIEKIPETVTHLKLTCGEQVIDKLPDGLIYLQTEGKFRKKITHLPETLKYLKFFDIGCSWDIFDCVFPDNLEFIEITVLNPEYILINYPKKLRRIIFERDDRYLDRFSDEYIHGLEKYGVYFHYEFVELGQNPSIPLAQKYFSKREETIEQFIASLTK